MSWRLREIYETARGRSMHATLADKDACVILEPEPGWILSISSSTQKPGRLVMFDGTRFHYPRSGEEIFRAIDTALAEREIELHTPN